MHRLGLLLILCQILSALNAADGAWPDAVPRPLSWKPDATRSAPPPATVPPDYARRRDAVLAAVDLKSLERRPENGVSIVLRVDQSLAERLGIGVGDIITSLSDRRLRSSDSWQSTPGRIEWVTTGGETKSAEWDGSRLGLAHVTWWAPAAGIVRRHRAAPWFRDLLMACQRTRTFSKLANPNCYEVGVGVIPC